MRRRAVVVVVDVADVPPPMATVVPTLDPPAVLIRCTVSGGSRSDVDGWPVAVEPPLLMPLSEGELLGVRRGRSMVGVCFFAWLLALEHELLADWTT